MMGCPTYDLTFKRFQRVNAERCKRWHGDAEPWTLADWLTAMMGEAGEACDIAKKLKRDEQSIPGNRGASRRALQARFAEELADTLTYLFLVADAADIDIEAALIEKFNSVSQRNDFPERV